MACSGSLTPCFVYNDYVTAQIAYSTAHACHKVLTWSWVVCSNAYVSSTRSGRNYCCIMGVSLGSAIRGETIAWILLQLLHQQGDNTVMAAVSARREVVCSYVYGCCASQNRINVSAFPMAPRIFFWPLSSHLAYPGFSEQCAQCEQQDNQHCEQDEEQCTLVIRDEKLCSHQWEESRRMELLGRHQRPFQI